MPHLLIVNADDFGGNPLATDRILECFVAKRITSTSAMVNMSDSRRGAELVRARGLPIGLHLNLTQAFEDPQTPVAVRERQERLVKYFAGARRRRITYNPSLVSLVRACVDDQLACFDELFGMEPTHIDGHNHVHLSPTALIALPKGMPVRTGESRAGDGKVTLGAPLSRARHALIAHRQLTTDRFFAVDRLGASPSAGEIEALLGIADRLTVEIMVHPDRGRDFDVLMSEQWRSVLAARTCGSFAELASMSRR